MFHVTIVLHFYTYNFLEYGSIWILPIFFLIFKIISFQYTHLFQYNYLNDFENYKASAFYSRRNVYLSRFVYLIFWLYYWKFRVPFNCDLLALYYPICKRVFNYQSLCFWSFRLRIKEKLIEYHVFNLVVIIMKKILEKYSFYTLTDCFIPANFTIIGCYTFCLFIPIEKYLIWWKS